ncbi:MAG: DUF262 domain-containing protein [Flavobacterium sp.]|nr:MAG: DUF262 domain-containing protein [Flavobacterium sp.]
MSDTVWRYFELFLLKINKMGTQTNNTFSIKAKTCTLLCKSQEENDCILGNGVQYVIPIYQRPYSWTYEQIRKFIDDIFTSFWGENRNSASEPMFIGTMQLSNSKEILNGKEIIDGQQRLTTFLLLLKILKTQYPENNKLNNIELNWLQTKVNNGKQQKFLQECLNAAEHITPNEVNSYLNNAYIIREIFNEEILTDKDEADFIFDTDKFVDYLFSNIYFVVIETQAPLTKTLQIFNAINTTGLDLNGGDIFKIKMFEYLTRIENKPDTVFEEISRLYETVDSYNAENKEITTDIPGILGIYKYILISKFGLDKSLNQYSTNHFYDLLFDNLLSNGNNKEFKGKSIKLSLDEIEKLVNVRYEWEKNQFPTAEDASAMQLIWWSRYGRYWVLDFVFMYAFCDDENCWQNLWIFNRKLSKLYSVYSVRYAKGLNRIHTFTYHLIDLILKKDFEGIITSINNLIISEENKPVFEKLINGDITENTKVKNIVCRLSALLAEKEIFSAKDDESIKRVRNIFDGQVDIEHIEAYNYFDETLREEKRIEWADKINSLGNLMVLESSINRSISNKPYSEKLLKYPSSSFTIVKKQAELAEWNLEKCELRRDVEAKKIVEYLFN